MPDWQFSPDGHSATLDTQFVRMRVTPDLANTTSSDAMRYHAVVYNSQLDELAHARAMTSMAEAQTWCLRRYSTMLWNERKWVDDFRAPRAQP